MNALSWFIYLAGVSQGLTTFFGFMSFGFIAGFFMWLIPTAIESGKPVFKYWLLIFGIFFGLIANALPSKDTLYAIAASEMGERVLKTEQAQGVVDDATKALRSWLQSQIKTSDPVKKPN